jgi:uncharacterized membrane protein
VSTSLEQEVARYVEAVRAALADVPAAERDELIEDLRDHLAEVAADGEGSLADRLGPPAGYAAELRASAGLRPAPTGTVRDRLAAVAGDARLNLARFDVKAGPVIGYARVSDFLRLLRPAWWVFRGYLAAMAVSWLLNNSGGIGLVPRLADSVIAGLVMLLGFVIGSIWLGLRGQALGLWGRRAATAGTALAVLFGGIGLLESDDRARWGEDRYMPVYGDLYEHIRDVYVYDSDGRLLTNVRLYDQDGQPVQLGDVYCDSPGQPPPAIGVYPRCVPLAPFGGQPSPEPTATPPPAPTPEPSATVTSGPTATVAPSPTATVAPSRTATVAPSPTR